MTFSFNVITKALSATATQQVVAVDAPVFSVASGTSFDDLTGSVSLSCATSGATIYYNMTTNGSTPADPTSSSTTYSSAIALNSYATYHIKAVAIKNGTSSSVVSATYTVAAPTYTVAGNNTTLFGVAWDPSQTANDMTGPDANGVYTWQKTNVSLNAGTISFKVVKNRNWDTAYPGQDYNITVPAAGVYNLTITFDKDDNSVTPELVRIPQSYTVAGNNTALFGAAWDETRTANDMTASGSTYTWTSSTVSLEAGNVAFKVVVDHSWDIGSYPTDNYIVNVPSAGFYYLTVTFNASTEAVSATLTPVVGKTYTLHVYDPEGAPTVNGTTLATTMNGTNCTWYTYTYSGTTLPSSITLANHAGTKTQTITPVDGATDYRAYNGYSIQTVTADYDPAVRHLISWGSGGNYTSGTDAVPTTIDGVNYTVGNITLYGDDWLVFTTAYTGDWNTDSRTFYGSSSNVTVSGTSGSGTGEKGQTGIIHVTSPGIWSFSYNIITNAWTATRTGTIPSNTFTLHVIDYYDATPTLYAWGASGNLNGDFPGTVMSTTETSAAGETWFVQSFTTPAATINAIVSLGSGATQTTDITGIAPGDYYIVYNSQTHAYTGSTTCPTGKVQRQKNSFTIYVMADAAPHIYLWDDNNQPIGTAWPGTLLNTTEQLADGNTWYKFEVEIWDADINLLFHDGNGHQTGNIKQTDAVAYYVYDGSTSAVTLLEPSGRLYIVGHAAGNPWHTNMGVEMKAQNTDKTIFKAEKVLLMPGNSGFAFATMLCATQDDWTTLNAHRYGSTASGTKWEFTEAQLGQWQTNLQIDNHQDKNFGVETAGYYDVEVNLVTRQVKLTRSFGMLYMYYGNSESATWKANAGVAMMTTDGNTYTLASVALADGDTFQFTRSLGANATIWPATDQRWGSNAQGEYWLVTEEEINAVLGDALAQGSTKDFKIDTGAGGTYRVVVNLNLRTVTLYGMATVLDSKTIIHLEQSASVTNPKLWAYDKERDTQDTHYIHVDRPARTEIATNRLMKLEAVPDDAKTITTADGRRWWTWEVQNAIADFWFTRGDYTGTYNKATDESNSDMTDIQWRKSGEIFLTWPATGTALEEYTRDYYAAAAQEAPECAVMIEGHLYAYFTNTPGWDNVFCHAWYTDGQGVNHDLLKNDYTTGDSWYPGAPCELVGYDKDGYEVWRIDLSAAGVTDATYPVGIIFNNGIDNHHDFASNTTTNLAKEQSGDFVYSNGACYDFRGTIVLGRSLGNIIRNGVKDGPAYTIEEGLLGVYFDPVAITQVEVDGQQRNVYGALYCKDLNNFVSTAYVEKSLQQEGQVDYMQNYYPYFGQHVDGYPDAPDRYDQSNWVKLTLSATYPGFATMTEQDQCNVLAAYQGKLLPAECVQAQLVDNRNPEMRLLALNISANDCANADFTPNVYTPYSFVGNQTGTSHMGESIDFFFVTPKPQEYAIITWAVYGDDDAFYACKNTTWDYQDGTKYFLNGFDLSGYFPVSWDVILQPTGIDAYVGQMFMFDGIIHLADESAQSAQHIAPRRVPENSVEWKTNVTSSNYVVSPVEIDLRDEGGSIITAVCDLATAQPQVSSVTYYNVAGIASQQPFEGVNIVVTRHADGSTTTTKVLR